MPSREKNKKKEFATIGGVSLWVLILDGAIRAMAGFIALRFLNALLNWWKNSKNKN